MGRERRVGRVAVPCTCGELVQGALGGEPYLVSCPIDRYSQVSVTLNGESMHGQVGRTRLLDDSGEDTDSRYREGESPAEPWRMSTGGSGGPSPSRENRRPSSTATQSPCTPGPSPGMQSTPKAFRAARATLELLGWAEIPFELEVSCPLPPSKGFGSSTADVVGAIAATAMALEVSLSPEEMARLAVAVEPSDGTMFPGLALFDHRRCNRWESLGPAPPLWVVALDYEGTVDTLDYNARLDLGRLRTQESEHALALDLLRQGLRQRRLDLIGKAATLSAESNQSLLRKPDLGRVITLGREHGALGVCAAHSGTALGVLFGPGDLRAAQRLQSEAGRRLEGLSSAWVTQMVEGGARPMGDHSRKHIGLKSVPTPAPWR